MVLYILSSIISYHFSASGWTGGWWSCYASLLFFLCWVLWVDGGRAVLFFLSFCSFLLDVGWWVGGRQVVGSGRAIFSSSYSFPAGCGLVVGGGWVVVEPSGGNGFPRRWFFTSPLPFPPIFPLNTFSSESYIFLPSMSQCPRNV